MPNDGLEIWVVYSRPRDLPDAAFVLRRQWAERDGTIAVDSTCFVADTLDGIRAFVPRGKVLLDRHPSDDPVIVETWL